MALPWVFAPPQGSPFGRGPSVGRRGGFHIRPQAFAPPRGAAGWGIPPYGRPESGSRSFSPRARPGWPKTQNLFVGA